MNFRFGWEKSVDSTRWPIPLILKLPLGCRLSSFRYAVAVLFDVFDSSNLTVMGMRGVEEWIGISFLYIFFNTYSSKMFGAGPPKVSEEEFKQVNIYDTEFRNVG